MMSILYSLALIFFFVSIFRNILFWLYLLQLKEYRMDRLLIHFLETSEGKKIVVNPDSLLKLSLLCFYFLLLVYGSSFDLYSIAVTSVLFLSVIKVIQDFRTKTLKVPQPTLKIYAIFICTSIFVSFVVLFSPLDNFFWLLFVERVTPFFIFVLIALFWIPFEFYKEYFLYRAVEKRKKLSHLKVIGITGSYGKGSAKEFVSEILNSYFSVERTHGNENTAIGIGKTLVNHVTSATNIFVAEMGAYKKGDIALLCQIAKPSIGILTAINNQHASLFGSIENTKEAKYELIQSLPKDGLALFNGNNANVFELYKKTKHVKKILYYSTFKTDELINIAPDIIASDIIVNKFSVHFKITIKNSITISAKVFLVGAHFIESLLPAIYVAYYLGMKKGEITKALLNVHPLARTMEPYKSSSGAILIDDTYNANPQAIYAALSYLESYKTLYKKVFILQPMIELGKSAYQIHQEVAQKIGEICDVCIVTNPNFKSVIKKGIEENNTCTFYQMNSAEIAAYVSGLKKNNVVIFEGKESGDAISLIVKERVQYS